MRTPTLWAETDSAVWQQALDRYPDVIAQQPAPRLVELDTWYRDVLTPIVQARTPRRVTHEELVRITEWKMTRGVWRGPNLTLVRGNAPDAVDQAGMTAADHLDQLTRAIGAYTALAGVGPATASAVLAIVDPDRYPFFDELVANQISGLGPVAWSVSYYRRYVDAIVKRATGLGAAWNAVLVERALWANGAEHAGAHDDAMNDTAR
ncbi:hypothetical protein [Gemmatimonas aurantiaca]|uniref:hypothetical protein n=1 Tax=Gemmatimonas aurantiaca TaxID=173480 RepID=UPI00301DF097